MSQPGIVWSFTLALCLLACGACSSKRRNVASDSDAGARKDGGQSSIDSGHDGAAADASTGASGAGGRSGRDAGGGG